MAQALNKKTTPSVSTQRGLLIGKSKGWLTDFPFLRSAKETKQKTINAKENITMIPEADNPLFDIDADWEDDLDDEIEEDEENTDCPACGGSGGGPDPHLYCYHCEGTGRRFEW